jgi:hypothetical protein
MQKGVAPVTITMIPAAAALRSRTLSTQGAPFVLPVAGDSWRDRVPAGAARTGARTESAFGSIYVHHNSIAKQMPAVSVNAYRGVDAAKQVAPPRGVPR